ncbi:MAG: hypothetical protein ACI9LM_002303 [Alteromonadaceae bacterium]|jgi:hypothetical protein
MSETLYSLLPLVYRELDYKQQQPLRALMAVLETVYDDVDQDITRMYQNWFIETCDTERIPYIADLVDLSYLLPEKVLEIQRRYVANYLAYKRRSGMLSTLNNSVHDASDYACYSINSLEKIVSSWTERDPDLKPTTCSVTGVTEGNPASPFSTATKLPSFNSNTTALNWSNAGELSPQVVSLYLWRMRPVNMNCAQLLPAKHHKNAWFLTKPEEARVLCHQPWDFPDVDDMPLQPQYAFKLTRENIHTTGGRQQKPSVQFFEYNEKPYVFKEIPSDHIAIADLSLWQVNYLKNKRIVFDPKLARVLIVDEQLNEKLVCSFNYLNNTVFGSSPRYRGINTVINPVYRLMTLYPGDDVLSQSLKTSTADKTEISFACNAHYHLNKPLVIDLQGQDLTLVAEDYVSPTIYGDIEIINTANTHATFTLDGLSVYGQLIITGKSNVSVIIKDTNLIALQNSAIIIKATDCEVTNHTKLTIQTSLVVTKVLPKQVSYHINDSALVIEQPSQIQEFSCSNTTILGDIICTIALAVTNSLINGKFKVTNPAMTELSYSYFSSLDLPNGGITKSIITDQDFGRSAVQFSSTRFFDTGFLMLTYGTEPQILNGASNGEEIGVFNNMRLRQKEQNIKKQFDTFLPLGMEVQTYYMD